MHILPLIYKGGHLFVEREGSLWLYDTGAPTSFGIDENFSMAEMHFTLENNYMGLTAETLADQVGAPCAGLLGADILGGFDHILDVAGGTISVSTTELKHGGQPLPLTEFMNIPILAAQISGNNYQMFFDTGAQISCFQGDALTTFPAAGRVTDFYPGCGQFHADTYRVKAHLGDQMFTLRCGLLPGLPGMTLAMAGVTGIIGNEILLHRIVGYFPRRSALCL
jgi:hypothetical protein